MGRSEELILITGGRGALGSALVDSCQNEDLPYIAPAHGEFDITDLEECRRFVSGRKIAAIIHAAALVDWQRVHEQPEDGFSVNCKGTLHMSILAKEIRAHLVYVSTDAVFPGEFRTEGYSESETPRSPVSLYGMTKLMGEWICKSQCERLTVARLGWLFGPSPTHDRKFVGLMVKQIANGNTDLKAVNDKWGSPTYAEDAGNKLVDFVKNYTIGVRHVINTGVASRYDVAAEVVQLWGNEQTKISPVSSDLFPSNIKRPDYSGLSTIYQDSQMRDWRTALRDYNKKFPSAAEFIDH